MAGIVPRLAPYAYGRFGGRQPPFALSDQNALRTECCCYNGLTTGALNDSRTLWLLRQIIVVAHRKVPCYTGLVEAGLMPFKTASVGIIGCTPAQHGPQITLSSIMILRPTDCCTFSKLYMSDAQLVPHLRT